MSIGALDTDAPDERYDQQPSTSDPTNSSLLLLSRFQFHSPRDEKSITRGQARLGECRIRRQGYGFPNRAVHVVDNVNALMMFACLFHDRARLRGSVEHAPCATALRLHFRRESEPWVRSVGGRHSPLGQIGKSRRPNWAKLPVDQ